MANVTQEEVDRLVERIRGLVVKFGGQSPALEKLRQLYAMLHACPEAGAFVLAEAEAERLEKMTRAEFMKQVRVSGCGPALRQTGKADAERES